LNQQWGVIGTAKRFATPSSERLSGFRLQAKEENILQKIPTPEDKLVNIIELN